MRRCVPRENDMTDRSSEGRRRRSAFWRHRRIVDGLYQATQSGHPVRVETHISTILLLDGFAYKFKKPVYLDFVNYTTLEARHFFCEEEVRLNRRFAPELYLACIPISGSASRPILEGNGEPIEYAVKMKRFKQELQGNALVQSGALSPVMVDSLADTIARFHSEAPRQSGRPVNDLISEAQLPVSDNIRELQAVFSGGRGALQRQCADVAVWTNEHLRDLAIVFAERAGLGFVRECHGDLHLSNLVKFRDQWVAFDCIEFDPRLRWIDVMSDLAFPIMDLAAHRVPNLAYRLLNRYLEITGDYAGLKVLRFYLVYRALIRSKVMALSVPHRRFAGKRGTEASRRARQYLNEASRWARSRGRAGLIITHGVSGSGKSYASRWIAEHFGYIRIRSDVERKRLHCMAIDGESASKLGSGIYTRLDDHNTYRKLLYLAERAIASGWPVILDATFLKHSRRMAARRLAQRLQCPFSILALAANVEVMRERLRKRRGMDASEAGEEVMEMQLAHYEPLASDERLCAIETDSDPEALVVAVKRTESDW